MSGTDRRNWLIALSELGAHRVGMAPRPLVTGKLQRVDPYTHLVDVLQRLGPHPAKHVVDPTPRIWKAKFADRPLRSDLDGSRDPPTL